MAGKWGRALILGAVVVSAMTSCGEAVKSSAGDAVAGPVSTVIPNPPPDQTAGYGLGGDAKSLIGDQPLTPLQRRTAGDIQLRLFTSPANGGGECMPDSAQCVPPWCQPTGFLVAEVSNDVMAGAEAGSIIDVAQGSQLSLLQSMTIGAAEHSPAKLVMVRVAGDVSQVRLTTPDGADSAAPVSGLAVLAVPGSASTGTVSVLDGDGHARGSISLPHSNTIDSPDCAPGPAPLPKSGKPPADPAAADKAVRAAYTKAFTAVPGDDSYSSLDAVQGGDSLHATLDQLRHNYAQAAASSSVDTGQLVFTDPQTAVLKFTLHYTGGAPYGMHNGTAVFENGAWLVSKDTYCSVMSFGGARCPGS